MDIAIALIICSVILLVSFIWVVTAAFKQSAGWGLVVLLFSPIATIFLGIARWHEVKKPFLLYMTTFTLYTVLALKMFSSYGGLDMFSTAYEVTQLTQMQQNGELSEEEAQAKVNAMLQKLSGQLGHSLEKLRDAGVISDTELTQYRQRLEQDVNAEADKPYTANISLDELRNRAMVKAKEEAKNEPAIQAENLHVDEDADKSFQQIILEKRAARERERAKQAEKIKALHAKLSPSKQATGQRQRIAIKDISAYIGSELIVQDTNNVSHTGIMSQVTKRHLHLYKELHGGRFEFQIPHENVNSIHLSNAVTR